MVILNHRSAGWVSTKRAVTVVTVWPKLHAVASLAIANCASRAYTPLGVETGVKEDVEAQVFGLGEQS